jgi:hypothetical protein
MQHLSKISLLCCLLLTTMIAAQFGCSSSPETATTQPSPSPSATPDPSLALVPSPSPTVDVSLESPGGSSRPSASGSTSRPSSESRPPKPLAPEVERPRPPRTFTMASGRPISVFTESDLSTKTSRSGQTFTASLARDITDGDWVIAKKGAPVEGTIVTADPGGRVSGVARISVRLERLTLADGRKIDLSTTSFTKEAKSSKKKDAMKIGIGAGIGAAIGAIAGGGKGAAIGAGAGGAGGTGVVMATRGDPAVIPGESQLTFRLNSPITVTRR